METIGAVPGNYDWRPLYRIGAAAPLITIALYLTQLLVIIVSGAVYPTTPESWFALFQHSTFLGLMFLNALDVFSIAILGLMFLALCTALWRAGPAYISIAAFFAFLGITVFVSPRAVSVSGALLLSDQYAAARTEAGRSQVLAAGQAIMSVNRATPETIGFLFVAIAGLIISLIIWHTETFSRLTAVVGILASIVTLVNDLCIVLAPDLAVILMPINGFLWLIWWLLISRGLFVLSRNKTPQI